jgi:hypothetical protein
MGVYVGQAPGFGARRLMKMPVAYSLMLAILRGAITVDALPIPPDVTVLDVQSDWACRSFVIILESPNFPPTEEGQEIPSLAPFLLRTNGEPTDG